LVADVTISLSQLLRWLRLAFMAVLVVAASWMIGKGTHAYSDAMGVFDLRHIEIRGNNLLTRAEVMKAMALPITGSLFEVDLETIQRRVEELNYVYGVRVGRKLPHTLFVDIVENEPLAYVAAPKYFVLTSEEEALPLPHGRFDLVLPTISGADSATNALASGSIELHEQLQRAWQILYHIHTSFPGLYQELSELVFSRDGQITLYMAEKSTAIRLGSREVEQRIATLYAFLETVSGKRTLTDYSYIDLRYKRQVIVRERA
jgi:cell division septal protein FtsQ